MNKPFVAILMGSDSDFPVMNEAVVALKKLGVAIEVRVSSAHRTPQATCDYIHDAEQRGCAVFIAAAGMAAHLAGAVAANTTRPVIGVPLESGSLQGMDALLSTVQMPGGVPVACMAIGKAGAKNAAIFAAQVLALSDTHLAKQLQQDRELMGQQVAAKNAEIQQKITV